MNNSKKSNRFVIQLKIKNNFQAIKYTHFFYIFVVVLDVYFDVNLYHLFLLISFLFLFIFFPLFLSRCKIWFPWSFQAINILLPVFSFVCFPISSFCSWHKLLIILKNFTKINYYTFSLSILSSYVQVILQEQCHCMYQAFCWRWRYLQRCKWGKYYIILWRLRENPHGTLLRLHFPGSFNHYGLLF